MTYSNTILDRVQTTGIFYYPLSKVLNIIEGIEDIEQFSKDFYDAESEIYKAFQKGVHMGEYEIDVLLRKKVKGKGDGKWEFLDTNSLNILLRRHEENKEQYKIESKWHI